MCSIQDMETTEIMQIENTLIKPGETPETTLINKSVQRNLQINEHRLFSAKYLFELSKSSWSPSGLSQDTVQPYLRGCKWSPDGTCCLAVVNNDGVHVLELPRDLYEGGVGEDRPIDILNSVIHLKEGGLVYDYCWFPGMNSGCPETCSWLTTRQNAPVQMWDAFDGSLRCSYRGYNAVDEMEPALSVTFTQDGTKVVAGYKKALRTFETDRPGRDFSEHAIKSPATSFAVDNLLLAVGSWNTTISLYSMSEMGTYRSIGTMHGHSGCRVLRPKGCLLRYQTSEVSRELGPFLFALDYTLELDEGKHRGGVTHMKFCPDGLHLVSGARKDDKLLVWDIRYHTTPSNILHRVVNTNQRIYFDISPCGKYLVTGNTNGVLKAWDSEFYDWKTGIAKQKDDYSLCEDGSYRFPLHSDCCNSVSIHPCRPVLATGSGQHHFQNPEIVTDEDVINESDTKVELQDSKTHVEPDSMNGNKKENIENSLVFWWTDVVPS